MAGNPRATATSASILTHPREFHWGAVIAGSISAAAVSFFLMLLGSGVGLALVSPLNPSSPGPVFLTLGAIYFVAAQAFGFAVGGYLVGRLIGPEVENTEEEEFRSAAHGFTMWALGIVVGLFVVWFSTLLGGSAMYAGTAVNRSDNSGYYTDLLFRPAQNTPPVAADKAEAGRILAADAATGTPNQADSTRLAQMVSQDAGLSDADARARVTQVQSEMRQTADNARKAASAVSLWTAFALMFSAAVAVAAAISARWMDDRITFSFAPRR
jgi:hypothetical protein